MWIWNSVAILASSAETDQVFTGALDAGVTELYLYMAPHNYGPQKPQLQTFISRATTSGLDVWALDGDRAYFPDAAGPSNFYHGIENLIAYNAAVAPHEQFLGFQADNEPQDHADYRTFHNGIPDSNLSHVPGTGLWQPTQAQDREMLLCSWLSMHETASRLLHAQGLRFGAAMPWWTEAYEGEELGVSFPPEGAGGRRQSVMKHMMGLVDEYVVMSYYTDPAEAVRRVEVQAAFASGMAGVGRPRVFAAVEVAPGVGRRVSYGDTEGKNSRAVVLRDVGVIEEVDAGLTNRLWIATLGTLDWSLAATNFAAICPRIARQSHWLPACDVSLQSTHHSTSRRPSKPQAKPPCDDEAQMPHTIPETPRAGQSTAILGKHVVSDQMRRAKSLTPLLE
ncbi:hypothetical protein LTR12_005623 [Friedmanniomyces endolithicus]|nr:hypothetical protein LTR94_008989 [Friedmanniomyces endolithicus]KAK0780808.1 hypothetical protein LTR59_012712 [Friedmanniomyces endolithicus]KAK0786253.1 hypothetical protein LTR38_012074 [Friedmanniomyces endolithicus]KAK0808593.1 hypothetical protein LTR75_006170 [Friedmanniomyces endolithicus]KAK0854625.1 hypothetical protein LTS02_011428 [Friedmanniomyces endolithicus]